MAYVRDFTNDVFISYAHADNAPNAVTPYWVNQFVQHLEVELERRLGGTRELKIFFDHRNLRSNDHLMELLANARRSAVFIAVLSPSYITRTWTRDELTAFRSAAPEPGRIFVVEVLPPDEHDAVPPEVARLNTTKFYWTEEPVSTVPRTITPKSPPDDRYANRLQDLAWQVRAQLRQMREATFPRVEAVAPAVPANAVLLAQTTDDLEEDREQVRRYLKQYGIPVLPEHLYPQGGFDFSAAFRSDVKRARLFVQLLGPVGSRQPPDLSTTYAQFQYNTAQSAGLTAVLWRRPDIDTSLLTHHDRGLLLRPEVRAMGLEAFKAELVRLAQPAPALAPHRSAEPFIFINADATDIDIAEKLEDEFKRNSCAVATRAHHGEAAAINRDLEENIVDSDGIIVVYGKAEQTWVRGQLRLYNKLKPQRRSPPRVLAVYVCPPEPKPAIGMMIPEAREIDCRNNFTLRPVQEIVSEMRR